MRAPFQKAPAPRIRALGPTLLRGRAAPAAPPAGGVFRDFVATLEKLERAKGRLKPRPGERAR
ncbi:MAG: hypothetical protein B7X99_20415 [Rhizobiales bacterium 17-65-6]|nr:MAG: hypothetical protein B7Z30_14020 [Rhizobiales bacterium 12-68-15]OYX87354.1 MAG: hypothetical protein B7Y84_11920 [Azorhizobium sp. 32-67-21]OYY07648.1 MAG: hypothetical protein B7Y70_14195 [Rhizobiales bacterium 35-68-8]OYZ89072.1 MAG: hypothetical protein B7X99_20415 [Rhizobiales bacterium 17-65-6]